MANIRDVWTSKDNSVWCSQIDAYWKHIEKQRKIALEEEMNNLNCQVISESSVGVWREFLATKYIPWKHKPGPFWRSIQTKFLAQYAAQEQQDLLATLKSRIFACTPEKTRDLLEIVDEIYQFDMPSASGLLSLLFPSHFGTVDRFAIQSLQRIEEFKDDTKVQRIDPKDISLDDAVHAISIMRVKALENNNLFGTDYWTARRIDMVLYITREPKNQTGIEKSNSHPRKMNTKTKPAAWEVVDEAAKFLAGSDQDNLVTALAFSEEMKRRGYKGVQASDYVYGVKNKDPRSGLHPVFEKVGRGLYKYVIKSM
jgi:hypothetical protein